MTAFRTLASWKRDQKGGHGEDGGAEWGEEAAGGRGEGAGPCRGRRVCGLPLPFVTSPEGVAARALQGHENFPFRTGCC